MKRIFIGAIVTAFLLAIPSLAGAHSGTVTCDARGVQFTYNANFPQAFTATEHVGDAVYTFNIAPNVINTHLVPLPATSPVVVSATWGGPGSIAPRTLNCPVATPPTTPVCPPDYPNDAGMNNGVKLCTRVDTVTIPVEVIRYINVPGPSPTPGVCAKGQKQLSYKNGVLTCEKTTIKVKTKTKIKTITRWVEWCPKPPHKTPGVAG